MRSGDFVVTFLGVFFYRHHDGDYVREDLSERSFYTMMLYLNDDFEGGSTNFLDETGPKNEKGEYNITHKIQPQPGMALVFDHRTLHEGDAVKNGKKYIMRSDILFKRISTEDEDPVYQEAVKIYHEAELLESYGKAADATKLYRKAFKMSRRLADELKQ